ncbi:hypothetical protein BDV18DRAFT_157854 [Aspergillus unguis]
MADRPRVILEKSRTVRRRYQRSNKRFQFTASQIARIEREEERERRAQKLRDREKKRVQDKKKKAEKEAKAREERIRRGIPDPNAATVPASQPLLFNFIKKTPTPTPPAQPEPERKSQETAVDSGSETEVASEFEDDISLEDEALDSMLVALDKTEATLVNDEKPALTETTNDEDEFSDCSAFDDEDIIKNTETTPVDHMFVATALMSGDSFQDDTAAFLEDFVPEFEPGTSFDQELAQLDAT